MGPKSSQTKKRPAPSSFRASGPPKKKPPIASRSHPEATKKLQRKQPVTAPVKEEADTDSGDEQLEEGDDVDPSNDSDEMKVDGLDENMKDPKSSSQSHKEQRALQQLRRAQKPHGTIMAEAKRVWGLARQQNISKEERQKHIQALMKVVKGRVKDVVFKHDASRIIQTLVRHGGQVERDQVASELKGKYKDLSQNKYSKFLVTKLIRHCPSHRTQILSEFQGNIIRLLLHREASQVISDAFEMHANAEERSMLVRDFYGKEVALFDSPGALGEILKGADQARKKRVLDSLKENLVNIFNNPDKGAVAHPIVHRALWEYLAETNALDCDASEKTKARTEIFDSCQELLAEMVHTKDGSRAVREFIAWGSAKERKQIIKVLKPHAEKMCQDDCAQLVLFTILDVVDDTKLVIKSLVSEIVALSPKLLLSPANSTSTSGPTSPNQPTAASRRSILYLLVPRSTRHFTPALISTISETDPIRAQTSKKEADTRMSEIRVGASEALLRFIAGAGPLEPSEGPSTLERLLRDPAGSLVVGEIMLYADGDKSDAISALLQPLIDAPYPMPATASVQHLVDIPHSSRVYKTLIQGGHFDQNTKTVTRPPTSPSTFAHNFMQALGRDKVVAFASGNGAFIVSELVERIAQDGTGEERETMIRWFDENVRESIRVSDAKGQKTLLAALGKLGTA